MSPAVPHWMNTARALRRARTGAPRRTDRQRELEEKPGSPPDSRFDLQIRLHRSRQLAADGESQAGLRKQLCAASRFFAERLEQRGDLVLRNAAPAVPYREFDGVRTGLERDDLHVALIRKSQGVGREIQENAAQRDRMAPALVMFRREQAHGQMLFLGNRPHDVAYRLDHRRHRKDGWLLLDELITALREFDDVARHRRES